MVCCKLKVELAVGQVVYYEIVFVVVSCEIESVIGHFKVDCKDSKFGLMNSLPI
jgi:hypothetical protein